MISVCMATHNGEQFIREQLESIISQLAEGDEVVISDDGSTDGTLDIIAGYHDPRIKVYHFTQPTISPHTHLYVTRNFENALKYAQGDIIFLSDQDDRWMPDKVEKCVMALNDYGLVVHNMRIADANMNDTGENYYKNGFTRFHNYLMRSGKYFGCTIAFRKELLKFILPFPENLVLHDYWVGILAEHFGGAVFFNEPLIMYRIRQESVSHDVNNSIWFKFSYRIYILWNLYIRILKMDLKMFLHTKNVCCK